MNNTKKKVLYISYDGLTDPLGQSQVLPYLKELSNNGYQFTVLSFEKKSRFHLEKNIVKQLTDEAKINWVPLSFTANPPLLSKFYDRYRLKRTAMKLYKREKFDMVHCRSYVAAEAGLQLKRKWGVKFLFDMRGFWADERVDNGQWNLDNSIDRRLYSYYKNKENEFLTEADGIISLTQAAKNYLLAIEKYKDLSIEVIPCCADLDHFDFNRITEADVQMLRSTLNISEGSKVITYSGSVGGWYMTKEMFCFFKMLIEQKPEFVMLVLTKDNAEKVKEEAYEAGIPSSKILVTYSNREQLPQFLALSSCSIFFIRNTFSKIASSPTKHAELMGMGIPVICNDIGDTGHIMNTTNTGLLVNDFTNQAFQKAVNFIPQLEAMNKDYIRDFAKQIFDLQSAVRKYLSLYNSIFNEN